MTHQVLKSKTSLTEEEASAAVLYFSDEMKQWVENMRLYEEEQRTPAPEEPHRGSFEDGAEGRDAYVEAHEAWRETVSLRRQRYPAPEAHPEVAAAVHPDTHEPEYSYHDDTVPKPEPEPNLTELKSLHMTEVAKAEQKAVSKLVPGGKVRINQLRFQRILKGDQERRIILVQKLDGMEEGQARDALNALLAQSVVPGRTHEEEAFVEEQEAVFKKRQVIEERAAIMLSDIEDLTEETAPNWVLGPLE